MSRRPVSKTKQSSGGAASRVRIIAGEWRGRWIEFGDAPGLRPTGDRIRETLFNWLQQDLVGAHCLDLYAGSGVLGFESVSRGAASVTMVEKNPQVARMLNTQTERLETNRIRVVNQSATEFLQMPTQPFSGSGFDLVFVDPPFADQVHGETLAELGLAGVLNPNALVYVEGPSSPELLPDTPAGFVLHREGRAGKVRYLLLKNLPE